MSVQVTLTINDDLYRRAKRIARSRQQDVAEVLAESITLTETAGQCGR
jgi:predicted transcriptional regulator